MNIVIIGAGTIGFNLAAKLTQEEGHNLFLVDNDSRRLQPAEENLDVKTLVGDGTSVAVLREARVPEADLVIGVTSSDSVNVLACQLAHKLGAKKKIARIRKSGCFEDPSVLTPYEAGIDMVIYPEEVVAREVFELIMRPYASDVATFFDGKMEVVGLTIGENAPLIHKTLAEALSLASVPFNFVAISREDESFIPLDWEGTFQMGDKVYVIAAAEHMVQMISDLGFETRKLQSVFIYGGSVVGFNLAKSLEETKILTRILEPSRNRSQEMAFELKKVLVLHGEGTDSALLEGEEIEEADLFIAVTQDEEANLLSCILAKQLGAKRSLALVTKPDYVPLISALDVDSVISTRLLTINRILQFVRRGEVVSVSELSEEKIEAIAFRVTNNTIVAGMEIGSEEFRDLFPKKTLIGGIQMESGEVAIPTKETTLKDGDRVLVYATPEGVRELEKIFV